MMYFLCLNGYQPNGTFWWSHWVGSPLCCCLFVFIYRTWSCVISCHVNVHKTVDLSQVGKRGVPSFLWWTKQGWKMCLSPYGLLEECHQLLKGVVVPRWWVLGGLPLTSLWSKLHTGKERKCHLTSICTDYSPQTRQLASLPFPEEQKGMDGGLAWKDSLPFKQQPFLTQTSVCTEEPTQRQVAPSPPSSGRPVDPQKLTPHSKPCCQETTGTSAGC